MLGWEQALWTVMLWGLANVYQAYAALQLDVHPLVFTCMTFISASFMLTIIGGKGRLVKETLKSPSTWSYGIVLAVIYIVTIYLFQLVTATEGALMQRLSAIVALVMSFLFFKRKPNKAACVGALFILLGVGLVAYGLDMNILKDAMILLGILSVFQALQLFVAEKHPQTNKSRTVREECRVVGLVMFVVSTVFLLAGILLSQFAVDFAEFVPHASDFAHMPTLISGLIFGIVIVAPIKYLEFTSVRKIKSENFLAVAALAPLMTFAFEAIVSTIPFTGMSIRSISVLDIVAALLITAGALYVAWQRLKPDFELYKKAQDTEDLSFANFMNQITEENLLQKSVREKDEEAISCEIERSRKAMDKLTLKRLEESKLSDEEKELLRQQELKDAGVIK